MASIKVLDPDTAALIAAGEVIQGPSAVVKELVENSIDAGATRVEVVICTDPDWRIMVRDNGCGIPTSEAGTAFARHATSKIRSVDDLTRVNTLGFRGEALASIAAVAQVEMLTRPAAAGQGVCINLRGGEITGVERRACAPGTRLTVSDLFFNTPARRKQLGHGSREMRAISETVSRLALAFPAVSVSLAANNRTLWQTPGRGDLLSAISVVWGDDVARNMVPVNFAQDGIEVCGYTGGLSAGRRDRRRQLLVINGRPVGFGQLSSALEAAYEGLMHRPNRPVAFIILALPPDQVDVNVHPAKTEVRFLHADVVWRTIHSAMAAALRSCIGPAVLDDSRFQEKEPGQSPNRYETRESRSEWNYNNYAVDAGVTREQVCLAETEAGFQRGSNDAGGRLPVLKPIGQVDATYILAESDGALYLIDQHAAHERIRYTELCNRATSGTASQLLTVPAAINLGAHDREILWSYSELLVRLGFILELFGSTGILVRGVPSSLPPEETEDCLRQLLTRLAADGSQAVSRLMDEARKMIACKGAIKAHQYLDQVEMAHLLENLRRVPNPFTCPHGRPAVIRYTVTDLEKAFGRRI